MRIAIVVNGSRGDVQPMVAIAQKLQEHGHEVFHVELHGNIRVPRPMPPPKK